ncbi:MAG: hypothetical protein RXO71_05175 [Nitrososphaeria archaeon]
MVLGILRDLIPYHINAQQKASSVSKSAMKINLNMFGLEKIYGGHLNEAY